MMIFEQYQKGEVDKRTFYQVILTWDDLPAHQRPPLHEYIGMPYPAFFAWRKGDATLEEFQHPNPRVEQMRPHRRD